MRNDTAPTRLSEAERVARLRLIRTENVGPVTFHRLLRQFGDAVAALAALPDLARNGGRRKPLAVPTRAGAEDELAALRDIGAVAVFCGEDAYPPLLALTDDAPPVLFVRGHAHLLKKRAVAVVGSRNASVNGRRFAEDMAETLGAAGYMVVSGMARGIDTWAHRGALATGTLAVLGGGVDVVYPRENQDLYDALVDGGAVCSETAAGTTPQARHFPRRNRIISGIARAVVVIEAGAKSGSLITARLALEQGRDVFAVPGPPQDPRVRGANALIRDGAYLTECAADVLAELKSAESRSLDDGRRRRIDDGPAPALPDEITLSAARDTVLCALGYGPTDLDDVYRDGAEYPAAVTLALLELELAGRLERLPGNKVSLLAPTTKM